MPGDNFWSDLLAAAGDEPIEAVVIGAEGGTEWDDDEERNRGVPADRKFVVITADEAELWLSYNYDTGYGGADCHAVYVWTATKVIFVAEYDGSTRVTSLPRNPTPCHPGMA